MEIPESCAKCPELKTSNLQKFCYCALTEYPVDNPTNGRPYFCHYGPRYNAVSTLPVTATEVKKFFDDFYGIVERDGEFIPSKLVPVSQTSYKMGRGSIMNSIKPKRIIRQGPATIIFWDNQRYEMPEKTVVKCMEDDHYDLYAAFCIAVCKKLFGSNSRIKSMIKKAVKAQEEIEAKKAKKAKKK